MRDIYSLSRGECLGQETGPNHYHAQLELLRQRSCNLMVGLTYLGVLDYRIPLQVDDALDPLASKWEKNPDIAR